MTTTSCTAVALALPLQMQLRIVARWNAANPQLAGAQVADILDELAECDSDLDLIESIPADEWPDHPAAGLVARAVIWGRPLGALRVLDPDAMTQLLARLP